MAKKMTAQFTPNTVTRNIINSNLDSFIQEAWVKTILSFLKKNGDDWVKEMDVNGIYTYTSSTFNSDARLRAQRKFLQGLQELESHGYIVWTKRNKFIVTPKLIEFYRKYTTKT